MELRTIAFSLALPLMAVAGAPIKVSTFSTILTEIAHEVGGDRVTVYAHVKANVDPHEFEPKPADLEIVATSQLVLLSAKHMEGYVGKLREATGTVGRVLEVGDQLPSLKLKAQDGGETIDDGPCAKHAGTRGLRDLLSRPPAGEGRP